MVRIDHFYAPFSSEANQVQIKSDVKETEEYRLLNEGKMPLKEKDMRIMSLGDSFMHGGGLDFSQNCSQQLKKMLREKSDNCETYVLDLSRPGNNTLDNYNSFFQFFDLFKPKVVVLGYTLRDVMGPMDKSIDLSTLQRGQNDEDLEIVERQNVDRGIYIIINPLRRYSYLFKFVNNSVQRYLKVRGIIVPYLGSFYHVTHRAYRPQSKSWQDSQLLLNEMAEKCNSNGATLIVYYFPEFNVLEHENLFEKANPSIDEFFNNQPGVIYYNGLTHDFENAKSEDYFISAYDAHPNEKAHFKIAKTIEETLAKNLGVCQ